MKRGVYEASFTKVRDGTCTFGLIDLTIKMKCKRYKDIIPFKRVSSKTKYKEGIDDSSTDNYEMNILYIMYDTKGEDVYTGNENVE